MTPRANKMDGHPCSQRPSGSTWHPSSQQAGTTDSSPNSSSNSSTESKPLSLATCVSEIRCGFLFAMRVILKIWLWLSTPIRKKWNNFSMIYNNFCARSKFFTLNCKFYFILISWMDNSTNITLTKPATIQIEANMISFVFLVCHIKKLVAIALSFDCPVFEFRLDTVEIYRRHT